jgi:hypothetical protein
MKELNMYIPIRDETNFMIKYYQYLFNKYWSSDIQVYFLGYKKPNIELEDNMHFVSLAPERDSSPKAWSTPLIEYFESIEDEYFYFSVEDLLVIRPVDMELLLACKEVMNEGIGRIDLWNSVQFDPGRHGWVEFFKEHKGVKFCLQNQNPPPSVYRVSCSNSIWNRKWFLKTMERGWSTYDWETKANDGRNNSDGFDVLSTIDRWTPSVVHSLSNKNWGNKINIDGMLKEDVEEIYKMSDAGERKRLFAYTTANTVVNLKGYQPR